MTDTKNAIDPERRRWLAAMVAGSGLGVVGVLAGCGGGGDGSDGTAPPPPPPPAAVLPPLSATGIARLRGTGLLADKGWMSAADSRWVHVPSLPAAGANVIRLFIQPFDFADGSALLPGRPLSERISASLQQWGGVVEWALGQRMHVILALTLDISYPAAAAWPGDGRSLWTDASAQDEVVEAWAMLASRYAGTPGLVFDLVNEPHGGTPAEIDGNHALVKSAWNALHPRVLARIRAIDANRWVIIQPVWAEVRNLADLAPNADVKTFYSFHYYGPHFFTHQGVPGWPAAGSVAYPGPTQDNAYQPVQTWDQPTLAADFAIAADFGARQSVRIMLGELGSTRACPPASRVQWTSDALSLAEASGMDIVYFQYDGWGVPADFTAGWSFENSPVEPLLLPLFEKNKV